MGTIGLKFFVVRNYLKTTIVGGVLLIVPIVLILAVALQAVQALRGMIEPLIDRFGIPSVDRPLLAHASAILALLVICFVAGLIAQSVIGKKFVAAMEDKLVDRFAPYKAIKEFGDQVLAPSQPITQTPVLVELGGVSQFGFRVEQQGETVAVYLPNAPDPRNGRIVLAPASAVTQVDGSDEVLRRVMRESGVGATKLASLIKPV